MTPQELIEKLGTKHSKCGSSLCKEAILIGDVLKKLEIECDIFPGCIKCRSQILRLITLWWACGFTRSLQEISHMGDLADCACKNFCNCGKPLKSEANALINFLIEIFK